VIERGTTLYGNVVRLEPLDFSHAGDLFENGNDPAIWEFTSGLHDMSSLDRVHHYIGRALYGDPLAPDSVPFAIVELATGRAIGSTRFHSIETTHRKCEIGWTWLAPRFWRSAVNTECKVLLLSHAFECGANRVQFKANAHNWRSRNAIERLGAQFEGTHRAFRIMDGKPTDVSFYSILAAEWPSIKERLSSVRVTVGA